MGGFGPASALESSMCVQCPIHMTTCMVVNVVVSGQGLACHQCVLQSFFRHIFRIWVILSTQFQLLSDWFHWPVGRPDSDINVSCGELCNVKSRWHVRSSRHHPCAFECYAAYGASFDAPHCVVWTTRSLQHTLGWPDWPSRGETCSTAAASAITSVQIACCHCHRAAAGKLRVWCIIALLSISQNQN
jgi:hypothetical protein